MSYIVLAEIPTFNTNMEAMERTTPGYFDEWNRRHKQLLENDLVLHKRTESLSQQMGDNAQTAKDYADATYRQSTGYTDQKIADLINGAPDTLDTLGEIAKAMGENDDIVAALHEAMGKKANQEEMESWLGTKLDKTGDSGNTTAKYTSDDTTTPSGWKDFTLFTGLEIVKEFFAKVSTMASNLRWLYDKYNELNSNLNTVTNVSNKFGLASGVTGSLNAYLKNGVVFFNLDLNVPESYADGQQHTLFTITDSSLRPRNNVFIVGLIGGSSSIGYLCRLFINYSNGIGNIFIQPGITGGIRISGTYFV